MSFWSVLQVLPRREGALVCPLHLMRLDGPLRLANAVATGGTMRNASRCFRELERPCVWDRRIEVESRNLRAVCEQKQADVGALELRRG